MLTVIVQSNVGGKLSGHSACSVSENERVVTLIEKFCEYKGISVRPDFHLKTDRGIVLDSHKSLKSFGVTNGQTLYFDIKGTASEIFHFHNWWLLSCGALLISVVGLAAVITLYLVKGETPIGYGVVLDGGSTHTSVNVYQWEGSKWNGTGVIKQLDYCSVKGNIAAMATNTTAIDVFLGPCLLEAQRKVPTASKASTPIYFAGTAGLRLLNISNEYAAKVVLQEIRSIFKTTGFSYAESNVEILDGQSEGLYGWITVNALLKNMGPFDTFLLKLGLREIPPEQRETVGALDLGGASTQFSLEVKNASTHTADIKVMELYGQNYSVYSKSHLCYGIVEATRRYHAMLVYDSGLNSTVIQSPCHLAGSAARVSAFNIFSSPCTQSTRGVPSLSTEYMYVGTGDSEQCSRIMNRLFDNRTCSSYFSSNCFNNVGQPEIGNATFKAFAYFYEVTALFNVTNSTELEDFQHLVQRHCATPYEVLRLTDDFDPLLCLNSNFMLALLLQGYGFNSSSWTRIEFVEKVGDLTLGWTMGYMTVKTNEINIQQPGPLLVLPAFASLAVLFGLFLVVGLLLCHHSWKLHKASAKYTRNILLLVDDELQKFI